MTTKGRFKKHNFAWQLVIPIIFLSLGLSIIYSFDCLEFDPDEGINLMKALLVNRGYQLYGDIWNDQPPMLTHLLANSFDLIEPSVELSRTLILLFSVLLLWQTWLVLAWLGGVTHAVIGSCLLVISPYYLQLSVSVMVGLPALTLAMGSIVTIILWHSTHKNRWLIASTVLLSLSIMTKIFTFFLAPIIFVGIAIDRTKRNKDQLVNWQKNLPFLTLWLATFICFIFLLLILLVGYDNLHLLIDNHTSARTLEGFQKFSLKRAIKLNYRLFLSGLAFLGIWRAWLQKKWQFLYFAAWLLSAFILLVEHRPVWYHQALLIHIPALILVGYALGEIITNISRFSRLRWQRQQKTFLIIFTIIIFISSILLIGEQTKTTFKKNRSWRDRCNYQANSLDREYQFYTEIAKSKSQTKWIVTDSPMFAFRAGILVPPSTSVLSRKQLETGNITGEQLIEVINQYQPKQVFLRRFEWPIVTNFLNENYVLKQQNDNLRLYQRDQ